MPEIAAALVGSGQGEAHRAVVLAADVAGLLDGLRAIATGGERTGVYYGHGRELPSRIAFAYPGQGGQWLGMGRELLATSEVFRTEIEACEQAMRPYVDWSLVEVLSGAAGAAMCRRVDVVQPALFGIMAGLSSLWRHIGVQPAAVIGYSMGETAAAFLAGALSREDAARAVVVWSKHLLRVAGKGAMAVLAAPAAVAADAIADAGLSLDIAGISGPRSTVVSGDPDELAALLGAIRAAEYRVFPIDVEVAGHSRQLLEICPDVRYELSGIAPKDSEIPVFSTVTGGLISGREMGAEYWPENISATVQFDAAVRELIAAGFDTVLEVSPHPVLTVGLMDILESAGSDVSVLDTISKDDGGYEKILKSAAQLYVDGAEVDWATVLSDLGIESNSIPSEFAADIAAWASSELAEPEQPATTGKSPAPLRKREIRQIIVAEVEEVLGCPIAGTSDELRIFSDLGMTSFGGVQLRGRLNERLGLRLPVTVVFDQPSVDDLVRHILDSAAHGDEMVGFTAAEAGEDIAIVSMACRLPGGVTSPDELWELVFEGRDAISDFPDDRGWDSSAFFDPDGRVGTTYVREGGFLTGAGDFDAEFFGVSPREALAMDPQQRLLLESSWEVLERAGIDPSSLRGRDVGVFVGVLAQDYGPRMHEASPEMQGHIITGSAPSVVSGRVAYALGLEGPALTVDTACSSSLVTIHLAAQSLRSGECSLAIVGGVTVMATPGVFLEMAKHRGLSSDGRCRAFAAAASGTGFAEGVGLVLLERLSDARRLGHPVLAVLRATAVNQDGASNGLSAPNGLAQQRVIRQALASAGLSASEVDVVEAHGTGTRLGDPIEAQALLATYGRDRSAESPLWLGSIKSNIGHTQAAAGVTGVIKMVQAIRHGVMPQTLHVDAPSAQVDWSAGAVELLSERREWPALDRPRRAAVSSFGISGTNAHVILEAPPEPESAVPEVAGPLPAEYTDTVATAWLSTTESLPWVLSARSAGALLRQAARLLEFVESRPGATPADIGLSLATTRAMLDHRGVVVGSGIEELTSGLRALAQGEPAAGVVTGCVGGHADTVWVFPGQGAQWQGMAAELLVASEPFRRKVHECAAAFERYLDWNVLDVLEGKPDAPSLARVDVVQPALFSVMVGLAEVWRTVCPEPAAVVGHSQGEIAAAHVAGILTLDDAARIVALRSQAWLALVGQGGMAAVRLPLDDVRTRLQKYGDALSIAAINGPSAITVAGDPGKLEQLVAEVTADGARAWTIAGIDTAGHSAQVDQLRDRLYADLEPVRPLPGMIALYSTVTGGEIAGTELDVNYWYDNMREPVLFADALHALYADGFRSFLEISAHPMLVPAVESLFDDPAVTVSGTLRRNSGGTEQLTLAMATAFANGAAVSWAARFGTDAHQVYDLPTYAFEPTRFWAPMTQALEGGRAALAELAKAGVQLHEHPLLGASFENSGSGGRIYSHRISATDQAWVADHALAAHPLLPGTAFAEILWFIGSQVDRQVIEELTLEVPVLFADGADAEIQVVLQAESSSGTQEFEIYSRAVADADVTWSRNATGRLGTGRRVPEVLTGGWPPEAAAEADAAALYDELSTRGYEYGPRFRNLRRAWRSGDAAFAEVELDADPDGRDSGYLMHPALLDASLHVIGLLGSATESGRPLIPFSWRNIALHATGATRLRVRVELRNGDELTMVGYDGQGRPVVELESVRLREVGVPEAPLARVGRNLYGMDWQPLAAKSTATVPEWAILGEAAARRAELSEVATGAFDSPAALAAAGRDLPRFVLTEIAADPQSHPDPAAAQAVTKQAFALLRGWIAAEWSSRSILVVLTSGAIATGADETPNSLAQSPIWGLIRSIQTEEPGRVAVADLDTGDGAGLAERLREITRSIEQDDNHQFAVRGGKVLIPRLQRRELDAAVGANSWSKPGTVLITGGSGLLGRLIARHLVDAHGVRSLLLCSRSGPRAEGAAEFAAELTARGVRIETVACDVSRRDELAAVIASIPEQLPLTGVVHSAVVLRDGVLASVTEDDIDAVFAAKVDAAVHLDELTRDLDLSAFVLFSSTAATLGTAGQSIYAAANAYLDALARDRRRRGLPAHALAWGFWSERGASTTHLGDADLRRLSRMGIAGISNAMGLAMFDAALALPDAVVVPTNINVPMLRQLARADAVPEVLRGLVGAALPVAAAEVAAGGLAGRVAEMPTAEGMAVVAGVVRGEVAAVLGYADAGVIDAGRAFSDMGFDSLTAVDLRNRLGRATGLVLPATVVFDYPSLNALAGYLLGELSGAAPGAEPVRVTEVATAASGDEIAIVAMACRLPGGVQSPDDLWRLVFEGHDAIGELPADRGWNLDELVAPDGRVGTTYVREGGFLTGAGDFDAEFFGVSPREALAMDPQQRLLLESSWEVLERAGIDPGSLRGRDVGVFAGVLSADYSMVVNDSALVEGHVGVGTATSVVSGRVAYALGFEGPAISVDTACSSSLVAMHLAAQSLRGGECSLAIAGGVTVMSTPGMLVDFARQRGLAPDGRCKSFATEADGTGLGEGVGVVLLERLTDARRLGHPVLAMVRGSAVNQDGASNGLTAPNGPAQQRVIRQALASAGLSAAGVDAVEAHGTGTQLGDPIEAQALLATYGRDRSAESPLWLGSIKSNIGHTQAAAGVTGVIKMVQAMRHGVLPRTLHVDEPSVHVDWSVGEVKLLAEQQDWVRPEGRPRRAGVSSFGISGTNAHLILEAVEDPAAAPEADVREPDSPGTPLSWVLSARSEQALGAQARRLLEFVREPVEATAVDIAIALMSSRSLMDHRAVVTGSSADELTVGLRLLAAGRSASNVVTGRAHRGGFAMMCTGQGAQRVGMAAGLRDRFPVFAESFDETCALLSEQLGVDVAGIVLGHAGPSSELLNRTMFAQAGLFAVEVALFRLLESWGVRPDFVMGHSIGEVSAAYVAGVWSLADAVVLVAARGRLMQGLPTGGAMVAVEATEAEIAEAIEAGGGAVGIAAVNGPRSVVVSGAEDAVAAVRDHFTGLGRKTKQLNVSHAFHSPLMDPMLAEFEAAIAGLDYRVPQLPVWSNVTGEPLTEDQARDPGYWASHVRATVRFADGVRGLAAAGVRTFLELGPEGVLTALGPDCVEADPAKLESNAPEFISMLRGDREDVAAVLDGTARAFAHGMPVRWEAVWQRDSGRRVELPTYAFQRTRYWPDTHTAIRPAAAVDTAGTVPVPTAHGLAGRVSVLPMGEGLALVAGVVRDEIAAVLGYADANAIEATRVFSDMGLDSLSAVELRNRLGCAIGATMPATVVFDHPSLEALSRFLYGELTGAAGTEATAVIGAHTAGDEIAIVAMACRLPGGVNSPEALWDLVLFERDAITGFPSDRGWDLAGLLDPEGLRPRSTYTRGGGFIEGIGDFDAEFFGVSPREALAMDPQQRLLLESSWEVLERAGIDPNALRGTDVGVFAGTSGQDYAGLVHATDADKYGHVAVGTAASVMSGRIAYTLGFEGPAISVDTACSSSLVAMHLAAQSLRAGECSLAIAGGVTLMATPNSFIDFAKQRGLSTDGRCKSFADSADGTGWSEGLGVVLLERVSDARRLGHPVLAVLRGSAVNQDGVSNGLTAPNGRAQQRVIRQALGNAGLSTTDVDAVEAHGTGTRLGDPIEAQALLATYGRHRSADSPLWLGSIKSNIGHTQAASGVAGVIKMVQAMRHGVLPASLYANTPSAHVDWSAGGVELLAERRDWEAPDGRPRRAGVSSFGISGTNAHVILEAPGELQEVPAAQSDSTDSTTSWILSARSASSLRAQAERLLTLVDATPQPNLADVGWSLLSTRSLLDHRAVVTGSSARDLAVGLSAVAAGQSAANTAVGRAVRRGGFAMMFTGQGAQRMGMAAGLYELFPVFVTSFDETCRLLSQQLGTDVAALVHGDAESAAELLDRTVYTQAALFAVEVALYRLLESWGMRPDFVMGHSIGEISAAHVAGVWSLADAVALVAARGRLMQDLPAGGTMVAVEAAESEVAAVVSECGGAVGIAAVNGPRSVVVSGAEAAVAAVRAHFTRLGRKTKRLNVSHAFHSPLMEPMLADFSTAIAGLEYRAPEIPIISNVTGRLTEGMTDPEYWVSHVRAAVRFADGVQGLLDAGVETFLELGPEGVLSAMAAACVDGESVVPEFVSTLRSDQPDVPALLTAVARAFVRGVPVRWDTVWQGRTGRRVDLPTYAFQRTRFWPDAQALASQVVGYGSGIAFTRQLPDPAPGGATYAVDLHGAEDEPAAVRDYSGGYTVAASRIVSAAESLSSSAGFGTVLDISRVRSFSIPEGGRCRLTVTFDPSDAAGYSVAHIAVTDFSNGAVLLQANAELVKFGSATVESELAAVDASSPELTLQFIAERVISIMSDILGRDAGNRVDGSDVIADVGLSSLTAVEFRNRISHEIGKTLPATILYDFETFAALAEGIQFLVAGVD